MPKIMVESKVSFADFNIAMKVSDILTKEGYEVVVFPDDYADYRRRGARIDIYEVTDTERR